jgi:hypothetical protein
MKKYMEYIGGICILVIILCMLFFTSEHPEQNIFKEIILIKNFFVSLQ